MMENVIPYWTYAVDWRLKYIVLKDRSPNVATTVPVTVNQVFLHRQHVLQGFIFAVFS